MRVIRTLAELDEMIAECNRAEAISDDAMRAVFGSFRMDPPNALPSDPFAPEYRECQLALYSEISGRSYSSSNEVTVFDPETAILHPFPYSTRSGVTTGEHLMAIGFLLRAMALPSGSRVLEFGPGWGNITTILAKLGHRVTAVDIEPRFCELIERRAAHEAVEIEVVNADFFWIERTAAQFDAVVLFECFHHCSDHLRLLHRLNRVLAPNGQIFFGGEPITPDFPMPWGLRLDGNSLWAIRKNGWLELGFSDEYFRAALERCGWVGERLACSDPGWATVWRARRTSEWSLELTADSPQLQTATGLRQAGRIEFAGNEGVGVYGPYIALPRGRYIAKLRFASGRPVVGSAMMDVSAGNGEVRIASRLLRSGLSDGSTDVCLAFEAREDLSGVEVRLFCANGFRASLEAVEIKRLE